MEVFASISRVLFHRLQYAATRRVGWNQVYQAKAHPLWKGIEDGSRFYFVHSYYVKPIEDADVAGETDYICRYTSAVAKDNLFASQFHPEKSQHDGLALLKNFLNWQI